MDFIVKIWDAKTGDLKNTIEIESKGYSSQIVDATFSPNERLLLTNSISKGKSYLELWDILTGNKLWKSNYQKDLISSTQFIYYLMTSLPVFHFLTLLN